MSAMDPNRRAALIEHGLVWEQHGVMRTHTLLAGMSRTLQHQGVSAELIGELLIDVAQAGSRIGGVLAARVREVESGDGSAEPGRSPATGRHRPVDGAAAGDRLRGHLCPGRDERPLSG